MKKILYVGAEVMPFAATGGLGDVLGSLPAALASTGEADVRVILPLYASVSEAWRRQMKEEAIFYVDLAWRQQYCGVYSLVKDGVTYYFIDNEYYFKRPSLYGYFDDGERYAYFCMAVMETIRRLEFYPDVLHAHDWQSALSVVYLNCIYRNRPGYTDIRTAFTIHNIEYQGQYDFAILGDVFALGENEHSLMDHGGCVNLMKAAIECADRVTTVSPRYAEEIRTPEYAHGLESCLERNAYKLSGILNGIDYVYYDPENDGVIASSFTATRMAGKAKNKLALQKEAGLPERKDVPLLAIISRLASHKGLDIVAECIWDIVAENDVQLVILGKGEDRYEHLFLDLQAAFPDKVSAMITYDRDLSKRIYAATDIFLMPSKSEPCGLSQMIASRYGAIPVVRETGGLYDSIKPYWIDAKGKIMGNGFTFTNYSSFELKERTEAAIALWNDAALRRRFVRKIMNTDFSWSVSAKKYLALYEEL
ncbi:MAG: glycogen synthase GlgA [Ruminococcaceae bacterium]|nr:glycogen synthase GlgA [Oscillospiraceae bacterium]